jgi:UDP-glucuronate decarboxylase
MMVMAGERVSDEVLNLGSDKEVSMLELGRILHEIAGRKYNYTLLPPRESDPMRRQPDTGKMKSLLNYTPKTDLKTGLELTLKWYETRLAVQRR